MNHKLLRFISLGYLFGCTLACMRHNPSPDMEAPAAELKVEAAAYVVPLADALIQTEETTTSIQLQFPGIVVGSYAYAPDPTGEWWGLYVSDRGSELKPCQLQVEKGKYVFYDPEMNDSDQAYRLSSVAPNPMLFLKGIKGLLEGTVLTKSTPKRVLPHTPYAFEVGKETYMLIAEADIPEGKQADDVEAMTDYTLYLQKGDGNRQAIIYSQFFDSNFFEILWIGDLDRDNRPDLLLSSSHKYTSNDVSLCLSSLAKEGEYLGFAATQSMEVESEETFQALAHETSRELAYHFIPRTEIKEFSQLEMSTWVDSTRTWFKRTNTHALSCDSINLDVEEEQYFEEKKYCFLKGHLVKASHDRGGDHGGESFEVYFWKGDAAEAPQPFFAYRTRYTYPIGSPPIKEEKRMYFKNGYLLRLLENKEGEEQIHITDPSRLKAEQNGFSLALEGLLKH